MSDTNVILEVKNLKKTFGDHEVLKDINTTVKKGEVIAIIGPSGCGKSTFLRSLNLLEVPTSGHIIYEGNDLTEKGVDLDKLRQSIGMVFQHFNLFPNMTIKKNITLAPVQLGLMSKEEADKKAMELLERVGLLDKADSYPDCYLCFLSLESIYKSTPAVHAAHILTTAITATILFVSPVRGLSIPPVPSISSV